MRPFEESERRQADLFYADLIGRRPPRGPRPVAPALRSFSGVRRVGDPIGAGRLFDSIVHRGVDPNVLLAADAEGDGGAWEAIALPRSATPPELLPRGALVVERALGDGRFGCMRVLGDDVPVGALYGRDGRIRADVLVLVRVGVARPAPLRDVAETTEDATDIEAIEAAERAEGAHEAWNFPFLQWSPFSRAWYFPRRDKAAPGGRAFMEKIKGEAPPKDWVTREDAIVAELVAGNMPDALLQWIEIPVTFKDKTRDLTGAIKVLPDYLSVGHDDDYVQVPLDPVSAQLVADKFEVMLPTARICQAVYEKADAKNRLNAIERDYFNADAVRRSAKRGRAQTSTAAYLEHAEAIQARMKASGISIGELVAGHKKDVVIARQLHANVNKIAFQGFYDSNGFPHEPCYENPRRRPRPDCNKASPTLAHSRRFSDYSQGVRLVHPWMTANGERKLVADVLADPDLSYLISSEGPIVPPRIPKTAKPGAAESIAEPGEMEGAANAAISAVTIEAAPGLGTERTVAPIATVSPQRQMNEILDRELILFARARILVEWIDRCVVDTLNAPVGPQLLNLLDVSQDKALLHRLRPFPLRAVPGRRAQLFTSDDVLKDLLKLLTDAADLRPILRLLQYYGVIDLPPDAGNTLGRVPRLASRADGLDRTRFDTQSAAVERRAVAFKQDVANKNILHHAVDAEAIPAQWSAGRAGTKLEVARPVVALLRRLRERNQSWRAGTYAGHFWNGFSVDIFVAAKVEASGFWARDRMREFFRALNAACEQDAPPGRFAWKAIYNDAGLAQEIDGLYGAGRVLHSVPRHGPGPDMHVHLDVRPLTVPFDATTGFWLDGSRVVLSAPASVGATTSNGATREDTGFEEAVPSGGRGRFQHAPLGGDPGDNVEARWNVDATTTAGSAIDIVVHLHGYGDPASDFLERKAALAGLDMVDRTGTVRVRTSRPTLALVPRGRHAGGSRWLFDKLSDRAAFDALVDAGLLWLCNTVLHLPGGSTLARGRLTVMVHSGGGAGLSTLLASGLNPDEVVCFDSMYGGEDSIRQWAEARIASQDAARSGLRIFYTGCSAPSRANPAGRWVPRKAGGFSYEPPGSWSYRNDNKWHLISTEVYARRVHHAIERALSRVTGGAALADRFRVEQTTVAHNDIPVRYSSRLLDDIAAAVPNASPPPAKRPVCVDNDDWVTRPPRKPGGDDPPPPRPAS